MYIRPPFSSSLFSLYEIASPQLNTYTKSFKKFSQKFLGFTFFHSWGHAKTFFTMGVAFLLWGRSVAEARSPTIKLS